MKSVKEMSLDEMRAERDKLREHINTLELEIETFFESHVRAAVHVSGQYVPCCVCGKTSLKCSGRELFLELMDACGDNDEKGQLALSILNEWSEAPDKCNTVEEHVAQLILDPNHNCYEKPPGKSIAEIAERLGWK